MTDRFKKPLQRLFSIALLALPLWHAPAFAMDPASPQALVQRFLDWESRVKPSGAYREYLTPELRSLLSRELTCQLEAAVKADQLFHRELPQDKPPFVEGNLFLPSAWERPIEARITGNDEQGRQAQVTVQFTYDEDLRFTSTYQLRRFAAGWRITDILLGGTCDFCQRGSLRDSMYATLKHIPKAGGERCRAKSSSG